MTETTDPDRLADYSLHEKLARHFPDPESHGEYIGTSGPIDFHRFTLAGEYQIDFAPRPRQWERGAYRWLS